MYRICQALVSPLYLARCTLLWWRGGRRPAASRRSGPGGPGHPTAGTWVPTINTPATPVQTTQALPLGEYADIFVSVVTVPTRAGKTSKEEFSFKGLLNIFNSQSQPKALKAPNSQEWIDIYFRCNLDSTHIFSEYSEYSMLASLLLISFSSSWTVIL